MVHIPLAGADSCNACTREGDLGGRAEHDDDRPLYKKVQPLECKRTVPIDIVEQDGGYPFRFTVIDTMRIISGKYKGRHFDVPRNFKARPTTDFAKEKGADFLLRGVRSIKDFEYERDIADVNKRLTGIETVLLFTDSQFSAISSSIVRELYSYQKNIEDFLP